MRKNYSQLSSLLLFSAFLVTSCQKEKKEITPVIDLENAAARGGHQGECRLVTNTSEFGDISYTYNRRGLVDEWHISFYDGYFKMEYNARGRLIKSRLYSGGVLVNTIFFFYHNDRVVKEIWYDGDTVDKVDEVFYSFTRDGLIRRMQSFLQDYIATYKHTADGNVLEWNFYLGGKLLYTSVYTYLRLHQ